MPELLRVADYSAHHAGHVGVQGGDGQGPPGQTHYSVLLVSPAFRGMSRWLAPAPCTRRSPMSSAPVELGGMHALALTLRTPEEHAAPARDPVRAVLYLVLARRRRIAAMPASPKPSTVMLAGSGAPVGAGAWLSVPSTKLPLAEAPASSIANVPLLTSGLVVLKL